MANRNIALIELSWAAVTLVRWALTIVVGLYAFRSGGAQCRRSRRFARMIPPALVAPRLALTADRRSRRMVLLVSTGARLLITVAMTAIVWWGGSLAVVLALAAVYGVADSVQRPAQAALLPVHARNSAELAAANALWSMLDNGAFVMGSLLVGLLVANSGLTSAFAMCVVPLVVAGVTLLGVTPDVPPPPLQAPRLGRDLVEGAVTVTRDRGLRVVVGVHVADMFVQAMMDVLFVIIAIGVLGLGAQGAGWLSAVWGVGGVVGGLVASTMLSRRLSLGLTLGLVLAGVPLIATGLWPQPAFALVVLLGLGVGYGLVEVGQLTLGQRLVATDVLARVYGMEETLGIAAMALGSIAASGLVAAFGQRSALIVTGALLPVLGIFLRSRLKRLDSVSTVDEGVFEALRGVSGLRRPPRRRRRNRRDPRPARGDPVRSGRHHAGRGRRDVLRHRERAGRRHRERRAPPHPDRRRLLRRDRVAARRPAHRNGGGDLAVARDRARP